jgi:hypothetical protein
MPDGCDTAVGAGREGERSVSVVPGSTPVLGEKRVALPHDGGAVDLHPRSRPSTSRGTDAAASRHLDHDTREDRLVATDTLTTATSRSWRSW